MKQTVWQKGFKFSQNIMLCHGDKYYTNVLRRCHIQSRQEAGETWYGR